MSVCVCKKYMMSSNLDFWSTDNTSKWQDDGNSVELHDSLFKYSTTEKVKPKLEKKKKGNSKKKLSLELWNGDAELEKNESSPAADDDTITRDGSRKRKKNKQSSVTGRDQHTPQIELSVGPHRKIPKSSATSQHHIIPTEGEEKEKAEPGNTEEQTDSEIQARTKKKRKRKANKNKFKDALSPSDPRNEKDAGSDSESNAVSGSQEHDLSTTGKLSRKERRKLKRKLTKQQKQKVNVNQNVKPTTDSNAKPKAKLCETSTPLVHKNMQSDSEEDHIPPEVDDDNLNEENDDDDRDNDGEQLILVNSKRTSKSKSQNGTSLKTQMESQLKSSQFRFLNERLYKVPGERAKEMFADDKDAFLTYHQGFTQQVDRWPVNPVDIFIDALKKRPASHVVGDFGCGDAKIARSVKQKVHSFDLCAINKHVTVCDIAKVPLADDTLDVAVFCLSLMGTNWMEYVQEANRVLKSGGLLKVAEVASRFTSPAAFLSAMKSLGFQLKQKDVSNKMFYLFDFKKKQRVASLSSAKAVILKPCLYKKR